MSSTTTPQAAGVTSNRDPKLLQQILQAETRLGVTLPPSYRTFILQEFIPNMSMGPDDNEILAPSELQWARDHDFFDEWNEAWTDMKNYVPSVSPQDHKVYGEDQVTSTYRMEYFPECLLISDWTDGVFVLNPKVQTNDGEWEAWHVADWYPGARRWTSFAGMKETINEIDNEDENDDEDDESEEEVDDYNRHADDDDDDDDEDDDDDDDDVGPSKKPRTE